MAVALLFQILLPLAHSKLRPQPAHERLRELAKQMAVRPRLQETGLSLQKLAAKLEEPKLPRQEKQSLAQEEQKKIAAQMKKETQKQDRELLSQAAGTLQELEQQSGDGERKKDQDGGGGIQSNLPQKGKQQGNEGGGGGGNKSELNAQSNNEMQQGNLAQGNTNEQGQEKNAGNKNSAQENQGDPNKPGKDKNQERTGRSEGGKDEGVGRRKASDEIPKGSPPVERFYKPGEGEYQGIKGAGYVTVRLPEELAAEGRGGGSKRDSKGGKAPSSQISVSNVPLPKHVPDAPSEKQQMPLEYRGIIR
jgi:hypothetical protein